MEAQLQEHILVCGQPWTGKVAGNSTDSATLVSSVDCPDGCDPCRILQAPRTLFSAGVSAVIQLGLTPVTDLEHRRVGLQLMPAGCRSIRSLRGTEGPGTVRP